MPSGLVTRWFPGGAQVRPLHGGGFSGSQVFLVRGPQQAAYVLKAFAEGIDRQRAEWIHTVARHLRATDASDLIPPVLPAHDGMSVIESDDGRLWEMVSHVGGLAVATPTRSQIVAAMQALARVHRALGVMPDASPRLAESRGLAERLERASSLLERSWKSLLTTHARAVAGAIPIAPTLAAASVAFDGGDGRRILDCVARIRPPMVTCQVVLRDIWNEHLLFETTEGDRVAGIIDLHAVGVDTPATDLARLLGSWLPIDGSGNLSGDDSWWQSAIDAYQAVRPLGPAEQQLVPLLAATGIVFGLDNWFRWILEDGRTFPDAARVLSRIAELVARLPAALKVLAHTTSPAGLTLENSSP